MDPRVSHRKVIGVDIDIREHNRELIERHPMSSRIALVQGSSIAESTVAEVKSLIPNNARTMVFLDSMHTHDHVLAELQAYAPLVSPGSYCVVFDTFVQDMPKGFFADRPWDVGNNPKTAVAHWLRSQPGFEVVQEWETKLQVTVAPQGFLRRKTD
jgi:cephalosporin hydroxylase